MGECAESASQHDANGGLGWGLGANDVDGGLHGFFIVASAVMTVAA